MSDTFMSQTQRPTNEQIVAHTTQMLAEGTRTRPLSAYEKQVWGATLMGIARYIPFMSHIVSVLNPFVDLTANTTYVDASARMGIFPEFFYVASLEQRMMFVVHEAMHVANRHFSRGEALNLNAQDLNKCGDLEINTTIQRISLLAKEVETGLLPEHFNLPKGQTLEQYNAMFQNLENGNAINGTPDPSQAGEPRDFSSLGQDSSNNGQSRRNPSNTTPQVEDKPREMKTRAEQLQENLENNTLGVDSETPSVCGVDSEERQEEAEKAGVKKTSEASINDARENTRQALQDHLSAGRGSRDMDVFAASLLEQMSQTPVVPWRRLFRKVMSRTYADVCLGAHSTSYRRVNKRYSNQQTILPGWVAYTPKITVAVDTSGSMGNDDYMAVLFEVEQMLRGFNKSGRNVSVFSVDTKPSKPKFVKSVKQLNLKGGGGTDMTVAFDSVLQLPVKDRPDIVVLCTDGCFSWNKRFFDAVKSVGATTVILITKENAYKDAIGALDKNSLPGCTFIDVSASLK